MARLLEGRRARDSRRELVRDLISAGRAMIARRLDLALAARGPFNTWAGLPPGAVPRCVIRRNHLHSRSSRRESGWADLGAEAIAQVGVACAEHSPLPPGRKSRFASVSRTVRRGALAAKLSQSRMAICDLRFAICDRAQVQSQPRTRCARTNARRCPRNASARIARPPAQCPWECATKLRPTDRPTGRSQSRSCSRSRSRRTTSVGLDGPARGLRRQSGPTLRGRRRRDRPSTRPVRRQSRRPNATFIVVVRPDWARTTPVTGWPPEDIHETREERPFGEVPPRLHDKRATRGRPVCWKSIREFSATCANFWGLSGAPPGAFATRAEILAKTRRQRVADATRATCA
ncbi:Hypothetical predicted protein [Olea europaea subsp. europaea]|uniref:Uncharacterized protein n=1 Tax=Olea europaea subsp. europaea TaxID=158383 RepID=A0A8S0VN25_OLEEU|nr:Hypothetical predicted protein [Olea europaea subsp. europaea]